MKPRLLYLFLALVLLPLGALAGFGLRLARFERQNVERQFQTLLLQSLQEIRQEISAYFTALETELQKITDVGDRSVSALRRLPAQQPRIRQIFLLDADGRLSYPDFAGEPNADEREFLERTHSIWENGALAHQVKNNAQSDRFAPEQIVNAPATQTKSGNAPPQKIGARSRAQGWFEWYWGAGVNFIYWNALSDGAVCGVELNRSRLMAELIAELPETDPRDSTRHGAKVALVDESRRTIYQWGSYEPEPQSPALEPVAALALNAPLNSWRLEYYLPPDFFAGTRGYSVYFNIVAGLLAAALAIGGLAALVWRETQRELREAGRRVTFVNQVSHELKTPLTNIRMYAELLEAQLEDADEKSAHYVDVITAESQRLSRLINNVLTFSRGQRGQLRVRKTRQPAGDCIRRVVERFQPALNAKGVTLDFESQAEREMNFDSDALEQILGNLLNNIEKYAAGSGTARITSQTTDHTLKITVADNGSGITPAQRELIFSPFYRCGNELTEGVSGAGIGLTIARELARLHGGELKLVDSAKGAAFELTLDCA